MDRGGLPGVADNAHAGLAALRKVRFLGNILRVRCIWKEKNAAWKISTRGFSGVLCIGSV